MELGFRQARKSLSPPSGCASANSRSYRCTWAGTAWAALTQVILPLTLTLSAPGVPLLVSGRYSACTSTTLPDSSLVKPVQRTT
ncbi:Uncharacterised protein [Bordetella pertussis]|nr:Uncharacterised protein [Bordetella pertussis]